MTRKILSMLLVVVMLGACLATTVNATYYGVKGHKNFEIPYVTTTPNIDGEMDEGEWDKALKIDISGDNLTYVSAGSLAILEDGSYMWMCWNEKGLYFAAYVKDSSASSENPASGTALNGGDGIQIAFYAGDDAVANDSKTNLFWDFLPYTGAFDKDNYKAESFEHWNYQKTTPDVQMASTVTTPDADKDDAYTYTIEWFIPAQSFEDVYRNEYKYEYCQMIDGVATMVEGQEFQLNICVMDKDNIGGQSLAYLDNWIDGVTVEGWCDPTACDYFVLSGKEKPLSVTPAANGAWDFNAPKRAGAIDCDGDIDRENEWANALQIDISSNALTLWQESFNDASYIKTGSYAYVLWDENGLYMAFDVYDSCSVTSNAETHASNGGDGIQVAFYKGDTASDVQFWDFAAYLGVDYENPTASCFEHYVYNKDLEGGDYSGLGIKMGSTVEDYPTGDETGVEYHYTIEVYMPKNLLVDKGYADNWGEGAALSMNICVLNDDNNMVDDIEMDTPCDAGMITPTVVWDKTNNNTFTFVNSINTKAGTTLINGQTSVNPAVEEETEEPETDKPATKPATTPATKPATTPATQGNTTPTTEAKTEAPKGGCGSVIGVGAIAVVACIATAGALVLKKKED